MLKYGEKIILPHHMNSILVEAWDAFKVSTRKLVRDRFVKTKLDPLSIPDFTTQTQAYVASVQLFYGAKDE